MGRGYFRKGKFTSQFLFYYRMLKMANMMFFSFTKIRHMERKLRSTEIR